MRMGQPALKVGQYAEKRIPDTKRGVFAFAGSGKETEIEGIHGGRCCIKPPINPLESGYYFRLLLSYVSL